MKTLHLLGLNRRVAYLAGALFLVLSTQSVCAGVSFSYGLPGLAIGYGQYGGHFNNYYGRHSNNHFRGYRPRQRNDYFNHHGNAHRHHRYYNPRRFYRPHRRYNSRRHHRRYR